jgi:2-dehydro-3-deoxyphosphogluconate aldolase / (4S)-4-hydroxy-2-oxoglutarate aldolase
MKSKLHDPRALARHGPVIPVITIEALEHAVPMAQALVAGGVRVLEITLRSPVALQAIAAIAQHVPQAIVGAGTVLGPADVVAAAQAGSQFIVSPGYLPSIGAACQAASLPWLPGVATASEILQAREAGHTFLKFFPASAAGGPALLAAWAGPFSDIHFCPTGGITAETAPSFLSLPQVLVCGGSWLTPTKAMHAGDWGQITALAKSAQALRSA